MPFFEYNQNNSGGSFVTNDSVCHRVFIEAPDVTTANNKAFNLGIYFNGCSDALDCPCCGDRWYPPYDAEKFPKKIGGMSQREAQRVASKYNVKFQLRRKPKLGYFDPKTPCEVIFETIEQYAQYLADKYGSTSPDCRIYYADGRVKETFRSKESK